MELRFTQDDVPARTDAAAPEYPNLFTAIREQLGLKLTATKTDAPVLVIDRVTEPTPN